ncbi:hypothetical protein GCM10009578_047710 [Streptomyces rhizosphaericus]|uniref:Uncharacterized protein n=1 Tax=Streptomyces rhizosphaericus TaxID=114699 RepID=A0ABN1RJX8_9ACTN
MADVGGHGQGISSARATAVVRKASDFSAFDLKFRGQKGSWVTPDVDHDPVSFSLG